MTIPTATPEESTWTCPTHGTEYGDGKPQAGRFNRECPDCYRESDRAARGHKDLHRRYAWWRDHAGIPPRYRSALPTSIQPLSASSKALASAVARYVANLQAQLDSGAGLILLGPPGLGKTLALCAITNAACEQYRGPRYASWPDVLAELKSGFSGARDDPKRKAIERLRDAPFLSLDELAMRGASEFEHGELFNLIDHRYREELPTLIAANATPANFATLVGERISDRLRETGPQIVLTGDSFRGRVSIAGPDAFPEPPQEFVTRTHSRGRWVENQIGSGDGWL